MASKMKTQKDKKSLRFEATILASIEETLTWKTLGADTRLARAEERVAAMIPVMVIGPNPETNCITWSGKLGNDIRQAGGKPYKFCTLGNTYL